MNVLVRQPPPWVFATPVEAIPGIVGDGSTDCAAGFRTLAASGKVYALTPGKQYNIGSMIDGWVSGSGVIGDGTATIYMPSASFTNADTANSYTATSVGFYIHGLLTGLYTPIQNITLRGFKLESQVADSRKVGGIAARNVKNLIVEDIEIFGFPVGVGIRVSSIIGKSRICRNYIHDFTTNAAWDGASPQPQITGIEVDNDRINSVYSSGLTISENNIKDLTFGATTIAAYNYQTDGINVMGPSGTGPITICDNIIDTVGEGIDCFADFIALANNQIRNAYLSGMKFTHGASNCSVLGGSIINSGWYGISFQEGNTKDVKNNTVDAVHISGIDPAGTQSGATNTACVHFDGNAGGNAVKDNVVKNSVLDPGANGEYTVFTATNEGPNRVHGRLVKGVTAYHGGGGDVVMVDSVYPTRVRANVGTGPGVIDGTEQDVQYDAETVDVRSEYDPTTWTWTCQLPGLYRVEATLRFVTLTSTTEFIIFRNGSAVRRVTDASAGAVTLRVAETLLCAEGDTVKIRVDHSDATSRLYTISAQSSVLTVVPVFSL